MSQNFFYTNDGTPLAGQVPIRLTIHGPDSAANKVRSEANGLLNAFLTDVRAGGLSQLRRRASLAGGGYVEMSHAFGLTTVDVYVGGGETEAEGFFGGILIKPQLLRPGLIAGPNSTPHGTWDDVLGVKTSGRSAALSGRPAVPGTAGAETNWLVVQIHPTRALDDEPIKKGAVKIWRIKDPKFGEIAEVNEAGRYLVSTKAPGTEFYVCGKKMDHVPPFPQTLARVGRLRNFASFNMLEPRFRLRSYDLTIPSFKQANKAEGFIFFAAGRGLWGLDTLARDPGGMPEWQLLASLPDDPSDPDGRTFNAFGDKFVETTENGVATITCEGTNGIGARSGFTVTITPNSGGRPTLEGVLSPAPTGYVAPGNPSTTDDRTITYQTLPQTPHVDSFTFAYSKFNIDDPLDAYYARSTGSPAIDGAVLTDVITYDRYVAYKAYGAYFKFTRSFNTTTGAPGARFNELRSGSIPLPTERSVHIEGEFEVRMDNFLGYHYRLKGTAPITIASSVVGLRDENSAPFWPDSSSYPDISTVDNLGPGVDPLYHGETLISSEFNDYYLGQPADFSQYKDGSLNWINDKPTLWGWVYPYTYEFSGKYDPWNKGISSATAPGDPEPFISVARYYQYSWGQTAEPIDPNFLGYPYVAYTADPEEGPIDGATTFRYDVQPIARYPKRAAVFQVSESWNTTVTTNYTEPWYPRTSFSATKSREGHMRADEYLAGPWPTNVDSFPTMDPIANTVNDDDLATGQSGEWVDTEDDSTGEYLATQWVAQDFHTGQLGWKSRQWNTGTWTQYGVSTPTEQPDFYSPVLTRLSLSTSAISWYMKLFAPAGDPLFQWEDFDLAFNGLVSSGALTVPDVFQADRALPQSFYWIQHNEEGLVPAVSSSPRYYEYSQRRGFKLFDSNFETQGGGLTATPPINTGMLVVAPQIKVAYWGRVPDGTGLDPLFPEFVDESFILPNTASTLSKTFGSNYEPGSMEPAWVRQYRRLEKGGNAITRILRDVRTGGFLTHVLWASNEGFAANHTLIGNESGVVPFAPILQEWIEKGEDPGQEITAPSLYTVALDEDPVHVTTGQLVALL